MGLFACPTVMASGSSHSVTSTVFSEYLTSVDKLALEEWLTVDVPSRYEERSPASDRSKDTMEFAYERIRGVLKVDPHIYITLAKLSGQKSLGSISPIPSTYARPQSRVH
jgi:hypothetical protein